MGLTAKELAQSLVVAALLITTGPWMPVLCYASGHVAIEDHYELCCGALSQPSSTGRQNDPLLSSHSAVSDCGDCSDVLLVSVWPPEPKQAAVSLDATAAVAAFSISHAVNIGEERAGDGAVCAYPVPLEPSPAPLRC